MACPSTLWMGNIDPYMDATFITNSFNSMAEQVVGVKMIINKHTKTPASYCFVEFENSELAHRAMLKLNGKIVPQSMPAVRFKLNHASYGREHLLVPEYSLFVGDLSEEVDDLTLYSVFAKRYKSCREAKVVLNDDGRSKRYGFIRFTDQSDQQRAVIEMNRYTGLGSKPIRVSLAVTKRPPPSVPGVQHGYGNSGYYAGTGQYSQQYYNYGAWQGYQQYANSPYYQSTDFQSSEYSQQHYNANESHFEDYEDEDEILEDPLLDIDVKSANEEFMKQSEELYMALEGSRWHPLDSVMSQITPAVN